MKNVKNTIQKRNKRKLLFQRKGVVDVQFNWIFVMIAGVVMFLFIISIVFAQKRSADTQAGISAMNQIATLIKGKQQSANVYSEITIPQTNVNFRCDPTTNYFTFKIENAERTQLPTEIMFAPEELSTNKIIIWSQAFTIGFPVSVFTYITTSNSMILIYNTSDNTYAQQIYNDLPNNVSKRYIASSSEISAYQKYAHLKVICFDNDCPIKEFEYIKISPAFNPAISGAGLYDYGNITFHKKGANLPDPLSQTTYYVTKSGLYGAIFSDNVGYYNCQMSRALKQFEVKRSLLENRILLMQDAYDFSSVCRQALNTTLEYDINKMKDPVLNADNVSSLYLNSKYLDTGNVDLELSSCPQIY